MGRLDPDILDRVERLCDRVLSVCNELERQKRSRRVLEQITACSTSIGANLFEADEAMSRADFCRCLAIAIKEANETRFWVRLVGRQGWIPATRLHDLEEDLNGLRRVLGTMISRTRNRVQSNLRSADLRSEV